MGGVSKDTPVITNLAKIPFPGRYQSKERSVESKYMTFTMIIILLFTVGVAGKKLHLNSRTKDQCDKEVTFPPRPVSAKVYSSIMNAN